MNYSEMTLEDLQKEEKRIDAKYQDILNSSAKEGLSWEDFCKKAHDEREQLYFLSKYIRLKQEPTMSFDTERGGDEYTLEEFKEICTETNMFTDSDGFGVYATEKGVSDIEVYPSDFTENLYRTDFTHILWYNK